MKISYFSPVRALLALLAAVFFVSAVSAQQAYTNSRTSLRAGPDVGYPQVAWIGAGAAVFVNACVNGYHWCDVSVGPNRGWANARHLNYTYQGRPTAIYGNGGLFGLAVVPFVLGAYWDNHYRGRSWYHNRGHWNDWRPGHAAPRAYIAPRAQPLVGVRPMYPAQPNAAYRPYVAPQPRVHREQVQRARHPTHPQQPHGREMHRSMAPGVVR